MTEQAAFFEVVDLVSGNTVASYDNEQTAHHGFSRLASEQPGARDRLALVLFDEEGLALESRLAEEPISA